MSTSRTYRHRLQFRKSSKTTEASGQVKRTPSDAFPRRGHVEQLAPKVETAAEQLKAADEFRIELPHDSGLEAIQATGWQVEWLETKQTINITGKKTSFGRRRPVTTIFGTLDK